MKEPKLKKCKADGCESMFFPFTTTAQACSPRCALSIARAKLEKKKKAETRQMKKEFNEKDRSHQLKLAQQAFNAYIRERDKGAPCISCGKNTGAKMNAGHYLSVGAHPELRFEALNCWLQCEWCNSYLSGNIACYRRSLINIITLDKVEWLEGPHEPKNYTLDQIIEIKLNYRRKLKELKCAT